MPTGVSVGLGPAAHPWRYSAEVAPPGLRREAAKSDAKSSLNWWVSLNETLAFELSLGVPWIQSSPLRNRNQMSGERVERRLAAILAADVAGYSRLKGENDEGTLAALRAIRRELGDPKIAEHRAVSWA